ncbi:hypothetical protein TKK_0002802 [Trichogramma kaykai]
MKRKDLTPIHWSENLDKKYNGKLTKNKAKKLEKKAETEISISVIEMKSEEEMDSIPNLDFINENQIEIGKVYYDNKKVLIQKVNQCSHNYELPENSHNNPSLIISLCGKNEDYVDNGDIILFTGSHGGKNENPVYNQEMVGLNELLPNNCNTLISRKLGTVAEKPVKVFKRTIAFCRLPYYTIKREIYLYRGIYKIVGYWPTHCV